MKALNQITIETETASSRTQHTNKLQRCYASHINPNPPLAPETKKHTHTHFWEILLYTQSIAALDPKHISGRELVQRETPPNPPKALSFHCNCLISNCRGSGFRFNKTLEITSSKSIAAPEIYRRSVRPGAIRTAQTSNGERTSRPLEARENGSLQMEVVTQENNRKHGKTMSCRWNTNT